MPAYQGIIAGLKWGTGYTKELVFGYPLDRPVSWGDPVEGSAFVMSPGGAEDSDVRARDYFLRGQMRWIPGAATINPPATGWDGTDGVLAALEWLQAKNTGRFYPDRRNLIESPKMDTDTDANGVVNDFTAAASGTITATPSLDAGNAAQKVICSGAASGAYHQFNATTVYGVIPGESLAASIEYQVASLVNMVAQLHLAFYTSADVFISSLVATPLTSTSFVRASIAGVVPATASYATFNLRSLATGASGSGTFWYRKAMLERKTAASSAFVDQPGYREIKLVEPMKGAPSEEEDGTRMVELVLRAVNRAAFTGY